MKIAFAYPDVAMLSRAGINGRKEYPPMGVLYLAAVVRSIGCEVEVHEVTPDKTQLDLTGYDVVGFSLSSSATYGLMQRARENSVYTDSAVIWVGGIHASLYPVETLREMRANVVCIGESEDTICELITTQQLHGSPDIRGLCYNDRGYPRITAKRQPPTDLDKLPFPARELLSLDNVVMSDRLPELGMKVAHVIFSRGCPHTCRFCSHIPQIPRYRSAENCYLEVKHLVNQYGIEAFSVMDDDFLCQNEPALKIAGVISAFGLPWSALARVDSINARAVDVLHKSGCTMLKLGVDSGSQRMLDLMGKRTNTQQIKQAVQMVSASGIRVKLLIVHGFPGETLETTRETIDLIRDVEDSVSAISLCRFVPLPGSPVYDDAASYGLIGTHNRSDWDGNWEKFHIHHNHARWWGSEKDFEELSSAYDLIKEYSLAKWGDQQ